MEFIKSREILKLFQSDHWINVDMDDKNTHFLNVLLLYNAVNQNIWVYPKNRQRNLYHHQIICELRADPPKFFNYCQLLTKYLNYRC